MRQTSVMFIFACVAFHLVNAAPSQEKVDCAKVDEIMDEMGSAQALSTMNDKYKLPQTGEDFRRRCQEMTDAIKTLRKYNKECYSSLTQQVLSALLRTRQQLNDKLCKEGTPENAEALAASKCAATDGFEKIHQAEKKIVLSFQVLYEASLPDDKVRVRRSCCAVLDSKRLFQEASGDKCSKHEKLYNEYVDSFTSEAMGIICPEADKLECSKLEAIKIDGVEPKSKFFLAPMVKLVRTLDH